MNAQINPLNQGTDTVIQLLVDIKKSGIGPWIRLVPTSGFKIIMRGSLSSATENPDRVDAVP